MYLCKALTMYLIGAPWRRRTAHTIHTGTAAISL